MSQFDEAQQSAIHELESELCSGTIKRREFLARAAALGVTATGASALWQTAQAAPKRGGHFIQALRGGATDNSLDGTTLLDTHAISTSWQVRSNLTEILPNGDVVGELAESWEASADASQWRFKLRRGVEFHNGKSLTPEDVIWSINLHRGKTPSPGRPVRWRRWRISRRTGRTRWCSR